MGGMCHGLVWSIFPEASEMTEENQERPEGGWYMNRNSSRGVYPNARKQHRYLRQLGQLVLLCIQPYRLLCCGRGLLAVTHPL